MNQKLTTPSDTKDSEISEKFARVRQLLLETCDLPSDERNKLLDRQCVNDLDVKEAVVNLLSVASEPYKYDYFQTLRRLECLNSHQPRIGSSRNAIEDPIRLAQIQSVAFAPSMLTAFELENVDKPARLEVAFFGMFGPNGPLPLHLTNYAISRNSAGDFAFSRFMDVFHHRMLSLFYRAWAVANPAVNLDRFVTDREQGYSDSDRFAKQLSALFGMGMPTLRDRDSFPDIAKLHFAGRFACQTRNADGLTKIIRESFPLQHSDSDDPPTVQIEEYVGQWMEIPEHCRFLMGTNPEVGCLGESLTLGNAVWDRQSKFLILIGPIGLNDYRQFLPGKPRFERFTALLRNYVGDELDWELTLVLSKRDVPAFVLGKEASLGVTTWLGVESGTSEHARDFSVGAGEVLPVLN